MTAVQARSAIVEDDDRSAVVCEELCARLRALAGAHVAAAAVAIDSRLQPHPEEERHLRSAQPKRRAEFAAGRWCAREALRRLGAPVGPLHRTSLGAPIWPEGFQGSITHHGRFAMAAAHPAPPGAAPILGIDLIDLAEKRDIESLHGLFIAPGDEIAACPRADRRERFAALLSGKEATIKILSSRFGATIDPRLMPVRKDAAGFYLRHPEFPFAIGYEASVVEDVLLTIARISPDRGRDEA
jgi:4'-phosphopantetheinyl transferase EntD